MHPTKPSQQSRVEGCFQSFLPVFQESILSVLPQEGLRMLLLFDQKARIEAVTISAFIFILFCLV